MKGTIQQLLAEIVAAKLRHNEASNDIKRIDKDINDFSNDKDSKLAELKSTLDIFKKAQSKQSITVKALQKEVQVARLDSEQSGADLGAAKEQLAEIQNTLKAQDAEIKALQKEAAGIKVRNQHNSRT